MSTLSYIRGNTSPATYMVTFICNNHSKIHEGNTSKAVKKLSSQKMLMHDPVLIFGLSDLDQASYYLMLMNCGKVNASHDYLFFATKNN